MDVKIGLKQAKMTLRVITPLFLCGNNPNSNPAEFRLASLKGALRFWFRVANYQKFDMEKELFGSKDTGLGCFMMRADPVKITTVKGTAPKGFKAQYLLGQGLYQKGLTRSYIEPGTRIEIDLLFKSSASTSNIQDVLEAFFLLTHLGGLGSRSRRGLGSVVVEKMEGDVETDLFPPFTDVEFLMTKLKNIVFSKINGNLGILPKYTAFSQGTRILVLDKFPVKPNSSWIECLNWLSKEFMNFRSNLHEPKRFSDDTKVMLNFAKKGRLDSIPSRAIFGLPHNYFFKNLHKSRRSVQTDERRASPLLIHIHQIHSGQLVPIISFLPAVFLPQGTRITYKNQSSEGSVNPPKSFKPIHDFLDEMKKHEIGTELLPTGVVRNE